MKDMKKFLLIIFMLLSSLAFSQTVTFTANINWPSWAGENQFRITGPSGSTAWICNPAQCYNGNNGSYTPTNVNVGTLTTSCAPNVYSITRQDTYGDGWNGGGTITLYANGILIGTYSCTGLEQNTTFTLPFVVPIVDAGVNQIVSCHGNTTMTASVLANGTTASQQNIMSSPTTDVANTEVSVTLTGAPAGATITSITFTPRVRVEYCTFAIGPFCLSTAYGTCQSYNSWVKMQYWNGTAWVDITYCNTPITINNFNGTVIKIRTTDIPPDGPDNVYTDLLNVTATYQYSPTATYSWSPNVVNGYTTLSSSSVLNPTVTPATTTTYTLTVTSSSGCVASDDVLITMPCSLPVELIDFNVNCDNSGTSISWTTGSEINSDYFIVQRSRDLENWSLVDIVGAAGNSSDTSGYKIMDYSKSGGIVYYRLIQYDFDGKYEIFDPLSSSCFENVSFISVNLNPNPGSFNLQINAVENIGMTDLYICDLTGKIVWNRRYDIKAGTTFFGINLDLENGIYFVKSNSSKLKTVKFVISK